MRNLIIVGLVGFILWMLFGKKLSVAINTPPAVAPANPTPQNTVGQVAAGVSSIATSITNAWNSFSNPSPPSAPVEL